MTKKKHLLFLGPTDDYLKKALRCNVVITILTEPDRLSAFQREACQSILLTRFNNYPELMLMTLKAHNKEPFDAVVSLTEYGMEPAALIASSLRIPGPSLYNSLICRDKYETRKTVETTQKTKVHYEKVTDLRMLQNFVEHYGVPVVLKPRHETGSSSVRVINEVEDISSELDEDLIIETFAYGKEYSCETFSINGQHHLIAVTEKLLGGQSGVVEVGHKIDPKLALDEKMERWAFGVLDALNIVDGVCHIEVKREGDKFSLIECHNRPGGDRIWQLVELATGFDIATACIHLYINQPISIPTNLNRSAAIIFFEFLSGTVEQYRHPFMSPPEWVMWYEWKVYEGMEILPMTDSFHRYGGVIIDADNTELLAQRTEYLLSLIEVS